MYRSIAAMLAANICAGSLQAQTMVTARAGFALTLDQALAAASATSPLLEASRSGAEAAEARRVIAGLRPNPSFDAMTENVGGSGDYRGVRSSETSVGLSLPLELGGKRSARLAVAGTQVGRAVLDAAIAQADLRLRVTQVYNDAVAHQRRAAVAREQVRVAAEGVRAARVRVASGRASPIDEQRADVARLNAEAAVERVDRSVQVALENLARLTGVPAGQLDAAWFERITFGPARPVDAGSTLAARAARADLAVATAQVRLARSQRIPDVTVGAAARRIEASNDVAGVFSLSVPLPFFNSGRAAVDLAAAQRRQADANGRVALLDAEQAIALARVEAANAATTARQSMGPTLAAVLETVRIARIGYREGKFGQLDLLEAERTLADTRATAIDALAAYHDAQARLERLATPAPESMEDAR